MKKCVFAGTFDPPTKGHKSIVENCLKIFDETVVAILINPDKQTLFTLSEREQLLKKLFAGEKRVRVVSFDGTAADLLERENTPFYVRGVRNTVDFEYENANYYASKKLKEDMVAIYFPADHENLYISSTTARTLFKFKKNYEAYIPEEITEDIRTMLKDKNV